MLRITFVLVLLRISKVSLYVRIVSESMIRDRRNPVPADIKANRRTGGCSCGGDLAVRNGKPVEKSWMNLQLSNFMSSISRLGSGSAGFSCISFRLSLLALGFVWNGLS